MKLKHWQLVMLTCASAATPAHAHGLGFGFAVAMLLMVTWPIVSLIATIKAAPGRRLLAFMVTLVARSARDLARKPNLTPFCLHSATPAQAGSYKQQRREET